jgi:hypothetical protein
VLDGGLRGRRLSNTNLDSGDQRKEHVAVHIGQAIIKPPFTAKRTSQYFPKNCSRVTKGAIFPHDHGAMFCTDFSTFVAEIGRKCPDPLDLPHLQPCHFALVFGKFTPEVEFQSIR